MVLKGYDSTDGCDGKVDLLVFLEQEASKFTMSVLTKVQKRWKILQSPKNMGNLGTRFLRKVSKSEEGLTRISRINVTKTGGKGYYKRL